MGKNEEFSRCPMMGGKPCMPKCMWQLGQSCAVAVLAQQAAKGANELFAVVETMNGNQLPTVAPDEGTQEEGGEA